MILLPSLSIASYFAIVCASSNTDMAVLSSRSAPPEGFAYQGAPPTGSSISLRVALAQADTAGLENALNDVSTPNSANFRKHLSKAEVCQIFVWKQYLDSVIDMGSCSGRGVR